MFKFFENSFKTLAVNYYRESFTRRVHFKYSLGSCIIIECLINGKCTLLSLCLCSLYLKQFF
jgi:hypothetical protein